MRAVDTNVLVRLIARDEPAQLRAAESFIERGAWVSHLVLAETVWVLRAAYARDANAIATAIEMLLAHESLSVENPDVVTAAVQSFRAKPALGFSDCLVLEIARKAGHLPMGTFDRSLGKVSGAQRL